VLEDREGCVLDVTIALLRTIMSTGCYTVLKFEYEYFPINVDKYSSNVKMLAVMNTTDVILY
jgi:hypothetical protein